MNGNAHHDAKKRAIENLRNLKSNEPQLIIAALQNGQRSALAQAITWVEIGHSEWMADLPKPTKKSIRIGISGVPGAGKSTLIDALGMLLIEQGLRVAVLAIDPSSPVSKGSILGDKTRMERLSMSEQAFVRPSANSNSLGGVAKSTREAMHLCELAGYDIIIIETVGVGQSEIAVREMCDYFLLLLLAGAGDQLQGIKRGIMEICDGIAITKADGINAPAAHNAVAEFTSAVHFFPAKDHGLMPKVLAVSAIEGKGIDALWQSIQGAYTYLDERGQIDALRQQQYLSWLHEMLKEQTIQAFYAAHAQAIEEAEHKIKNLQSTPYVEAAHILKNIP
jgi:LAO/AO transport system kinase